MAGRLITVPILRHSGDRPGLLAGNRHLLKRHLRRAESLCKDDKFQTTVDEARDAWNCAHPDYAVNPVYPLAPLDGSLAHPRLWRAEQSALKDEDFDEWSSLQPAVIDWFVMRDKLYEAAFPAVIFDVGFAEGQAIGRKFVESCIFLGPKSLKGKCADYFPTLQQVYEGFAHHLMANDRRLPLDASTTPEDLRDFAKYGLRIVRDSSATGDTLAGGVVDALAAAGFDGKDIAFRLGLNPRTVKGRLQTLQARLRSR